jgi:hypothetical protein
MYIAVFYLPWMKSGRHTELLKSLSKRTGMKDQLDTTLGAMDTQQITIHLPCRLAERAEKYAKEYGNTITGVVIEALDTLLRGQKLD